MKHSNLKLVLVAIFLSGGIYSFGQERQQLPEEMRNTPPSEFQKRQAENARKYWEECKERLERMPVNYIDSIQNALSPDEILLGINSFGKPIIVQLFGLTGVLGLQANYLWSDALSGLNVKGNGENIGLWDGGVAFDEHVEFGNRISLGETSYYSSHATKSASILAASGLNPKAVGMAPEASVTSFDLMNDISEMWLNTHSMVVSSHSYGGVANEYNGYVSGEYTFDSHCLDWIPLEKPEYLEVRSAGNSGSESGGPFGTLSLEAACKNCIVVGAVTAGNENVIDIENPNSISRSSYSSSGPTLDGRIKPDLMGITSQFAAEYLNGNSFYANYSGTSCAAPSVAGGVALLQNLAQSLKGDHYWGSTVKGLLIHSAIDINMAGPDYETGWGVPNLEEAAQWIKYDTATVSCNDFRIIETTLMEGNPWYYQFSTQSQKDLKVTLCYTDDVQEVNGDLCVFDENSAGTLLNQQTLVNDLDIILYRQSGSTYYPFVLDSNNPNTAACNQPSCNNGQVPNNTVDNVEQIVVENAPVGNYKIMVSHKQLLGGEVKSGFQDFSLIVGDTNDPTITTSVTVPTDVDTAGGAIGVDLGNYSFPITSFYWEGPNGFTSTEQNITNLSEGIYTLCVTYLVDCVELQDCVSTSLECHDTQDYSLDIDSIVTDANYPALGSIDLDITGPLDGAEFQWYFEQDTLQVTDPLHLTGLEPGVYRFSIHTDEGCHGQSYIYNFVIDCLSFEIDMMAAQPFGEIPHGFGHIVASTPGLNEELVFEWISPSGNVLQEDSSVLSISEPGLYTVKATADFCSRFTAIDSFEVECYECSFDYDRSGFIDSTDADILLTYYHGTYCSPSLCPCIGDSDQNGIFATADLLALLNAMGTSCP